MYLLQVGFLKPPSCQFQRFLVVVFIIIDLTQANIVDSGTLVGEETVKIVDTLILTLFCQLWLFHAGQDLHVGSRRRIKPVLAVFLLCKGFNLFH